MLNAGVSRGDITPRPGPGLQGHWGAPASHTVFRPLEVRAIVFERGAQKAAIATLDVVGVTRQTTELIRRRIQTASGIAADAVMIVCSHTHCAPATLPCMGLEPSPAWLERIEAEVAACVDRAARSICPVTLGVGRGDVRFNVSRRPNGSVDHRTRVLRVDRLDGTILATLFHYACHPTALSGLRGVISPDYPGPARDAIDAATGGTALFFPGCGGDLRPPLDDGKGDESDARSRMVAYGRMLGDEVCRVVDGIRTSAAESLDASRTDIDMPFGDHWPVDKLRALIREDTDLGRRLMGPWARRVLQLIETRSVPRVRATEMQSISAGPLTLVGIPGEPLQAIGQALEKHLLDLSGPDNLWPVGYANDQIGYFCTADQYVEGGYEPTAYPFYDEPAPFSAEERVILDAAMRLLTRRERAPS